MEVYHVNNQGAGSFKISVEVPNTNDQMNYQSYEVTSFTTKLVPDPEEFTYTMIGATGGSYSMKITRYENFELKYNVTAELNWNATADEM